MASKCLRSINIGHGTDRANRICLLQYSSFHLIQSLTIVIQQMFASLCPVIEIAKQVECPLNLLWLAEPVEPRWQDATGSRGTWRILRIDGILPARDVMSL